MYDDVLVTTDGSEEAGVAVPHALEAAERYGATLHVLSVVDVRPWHKGAEMAVMTDELEEQAEEAVEEIAERARDAGIPVETRVVKGVPHGEIMDYVVDEGIDLVVMGTHGRTGIGHALLGSVAEKVVRHADAAVLTVRADDDD